MTALSTIEQDGFLYIRLRYETDPSQSARLEGWAGNLFPEAKGYGTARIGPDGQRRAMEDGVKEALRAWLRAREFNRPREVSGRVAFVDVPVLGLVGPRCGASVAIRMDLDPIRPYPAD